MMKRRLVAASPLFALALAVLGLGTVPPVAACSYVIRPGDPLVWGDLVFTGTAVAQNATAPSGFRSANGYTWWTFAVDSGRAGSPRNHESVQTADSESSCGVSLALGHRYLVGVDTDSWVITGRNVHELAPLAGTPPVDAVDLNTLVPVLAVALVVIGSVALLRSSPRRTPPISRA